MRRVLLTVAGGPGGGPRTLARGELRPSDAEPKEHHSRARLRNEQADATCPFPRLAATSQGRADPGEDMRWPGPAGGRGPCPAALRPVVGAFTPLWPPRWAQVSPRPQAPVIPRALCNHRPYYEAGLGLPKVGERPARLCVPGSQGCPARSQAGKVSAWGAGLPSRARPPAVPGGRDVPYTCPIPCVVSQRRTGRHGSGRSLGLGHPGLGPSSAAHSPCDLGRVATLRSPLGKRGNELRCGSDAGDGLGVSRARTVSGRP